MTKDELDRLCQERRNKIRELCEVAGVSADEAEELVDNWNEAIVGNMRLEPREPLQHLLAECHELGERILGAQDVRSDREA